MCHCYWLVRSFNLNWFLLLCISVLESLTCDLILPFFQVRKYVWLFVILFRLRSWGEIWRSLDSLIAFYNSSWFILRERIKDLNSSWFWWMIGSYVRWLIDNYSSWRYITILVRFFVLSRSSLVWRGSLMKIRPVFLSLLNLKFFWEHFKLTLKFIYHMFSFFILIF